MSMSGLPRTIVEALRECRAFLESKGIPNARLNAEWLLGKVTGLTRVQLYTSYDRPLNTAELAEYVALMERRAAREPLQYILGHWQFRRLELKADGRALVPRPETELTAELAIRAAQAAGREPRVLDIGTGSGCIALSVASEVPGSRVWATDISGDALGLARENAAELNISSVTFLQGDLYAAVPSEMRGSFDVIVSNPPYVTSAEYEELQPEVREHEPAGALLAGDGGMQFQKRLIEKAPEWLRPGGTLVLEGSPAQILALVGAYGAEPVNDLQGLPRCLVLRTT